MNMKKSDPFTFVMREYILGRNAPQTAISIKKSPVKGPTCNRTVCYLFQKFRCEDMNLKVQEAGGRPSAIDYKHLKTLIEQNPCQSIKLISWVLGINISTMSDHLKKIGW